MDFNHSFPDAVHLAIGSGVPCLRPFVGIALLQVIDEEEHIVPRGSCGRRCMRQFLFCYLWAPKSLVLVNLGSPGDTLIALMRIDDSTITTKLQKFVDDASAPLARPLYVKPLNAELFSSLKKDLQSSIKLSENDLFKAHLKQISNESWKVSFGEGLITKKTVPSIQLKNLLKRSKPNWDLKRNSRVVTAIYVISGGLQFKAHTDDVKLPSFELPPTEGVPVSLSVEWEYTVGTDQEIIVAEVNKSEWIVAIECIQWKSIPTTTDP
jgi:hypothetical protein